MFDLKREKQKQHQFIQKQQQINQNQKINQINQILNDKITKLKNEVYVSSFNDCGSILI